MGGDGESTPPRFIHELPSGTAGSGIIPGVGRRRGRDRADEVDEVRQLVRQAGFRDVETGVRRLPRETATYIGARC